MPDLLDIIPGLREAVEQETLVRDAAFLVETENVGGFTLRPMTLEDYLALRMVKSPLLRFGVPTPQELTDFICFLSPGFDPGDIGFRRAIQKRCQQFIPPQMPLLHTRQAMQRWKQESEQCLSRTKQMLEAIYGYVEETFMDCLPSSTNISNPDYFGDGAAVIGQLAREYGWTPRVILKLKLKQIFQFMREIDRFHNGRKARLFNRLSDRVKDRYLNSVNPRN